MDFWKALDELIVERKRLDRAIAVLESIGSEKPEPTSRRGRKSMGEEERKIVGERMKRYWASRRDGGNAQE